jgi:hypothetical protein
MVRHPASLIFCRRRKAAIARAINDVPPPESTFLSGHFCSSHSIPSHSFTAKIASFIPLCKFGIAHFTWRFSRTRDWGKSARVDFTTAGNSTEESATVRETKGFFNEILN